MAAVIAVCLVMYNVHCAMYSVQRALCIVHCIMYKCTVNTVYYNALYNVQMYSEHCVLYIIQII